MYLAYDTEVNNHTYLGRKASQFYDENFVVATGWKKEGQSVEYKYRNEPDGQDMLPDIDDDVDLLIGQNIKFDLLWFWRHPKLDAFFKRGGKIWCTQYAEFLLRGMGKPHHMLSMDELSTRYGGKKKIDEIKILWEQGVLTKDIDKDLLLEYLCEGDVPTTEFIYLNQIKLAEELGMLPVIQARMDGLLATTEMEYNGLKIDVKTAVQQARELTAKVKELDKELDKFVGELPVGYRFNFNSPIQLSSLFYGGVVKYKKPAPILDEEGNYTYTKKFEKRPMLDDNGEPIRFKSGKHVGEIRMKNYPVRGDLKTKITDFYHKFEGFAKALPEWQGALKDAYGGPVFSTGSDSIDYLVATYPDCELFQHYRKYQKYTKDLTTYYIGRNAKGKVSGMLTKVCPKTHTIHHSLNHTSTVTGRLSSSDPNLQNIPRGDTSDVKKMFVSRFGEEGYMIEADYSQLEVVVQGCLSKDPNLCEDLRNRVDFHCKRLAAKLGEDYDSVKYKAKSEDSPDYAVYSSMRTEAKIFSFQRAYGAGKYKISASTGIPLDDVEALIEIEERLYSGVVDFNADVKDAVMQSSLTNYVFIPAYGKNVREGSYVSPSKTRYTFVQMEAPAFLRKKGTEFSFSPTQMKNYPVQGTGGEMVQIILGKLWRDNIAKDRYDNKGLMVNSVHDCVWYDTHNDVREQVAKDIVPIMESIPEVYKELFDWDIDVPFPVDAEGGRNMLELHHI